MTNLTFESDTLHFGPPPFLVHLRPHMQCGRCLPLQAKCSCGCGERTPSSAATTTRHGLPAFTNTPQQPECGQFMGSPAGCAAATCCSSPNALDTMIFWVAGLSWGSVLCAVWQSPCGPLSWPPQDSIGPLFWPRAMAPVHWGAISFFWLKKWFCSRTHKSFEPLCFGP